MVMGTTPAILLFLLFYVNYAGGWTAIPANNARYALRQYKKNPREIPDVELPRHFLHSIYKFGWCTIDSTRRQFLKRTMNVSIATFQDSQCRYMYLLRGTYTIRFRLQCLVMKVYVPRKFLFRKSRIPMYYCQGTITILMFDIVDRLAVHEFYLQAYLNLPATFVYEFYHPPLKYLGQWIPDEPTKQRIV